MKTLLLLALCALTAGAEPYRMEMGLGRESAQLLFHNLGPGPSVLLVQATSEGVDVALRDAETRLPLTQVVTGVIYRVPVEAGHRLEVYNPRQDSVKLQLRVDIAHGFPAPPKPPEAH